MRLYLVRHTKVNVPVGVCYGSSPVALVPQRDRHFEAVKAKLPTTATARVYSSPLQRCLELAYWLSDEVNLDARLQEMDFGNWEMQRWEQIPQDELQAWADDLLHFKPPNGENLMMVNQRCQRFLEQLRGGDNEDVIIITHAGVISVMIAQFLRLAMQHVFRLQIDFGGVTLIHTDAPFVKIAYINR